MVLESVVEDGCSGGRRASTFGLGSEGRLRAARGLSRSDLLPGSHHWRAARVSRG